MKTRTILVAAAFLATASAAAAQTYGSQPDRNGYYSQSDPRGYYDRDGKYLDSDGATYRARNFGAKDDLQALEEVEREAHHSAVEVRESNRRVARVKRGDTPLLTTDRTCLWRMARTHMSALAQ